MFQITIITPNEQRQVDVTKDCLRFGSKSEITLPVSEDHCATVYRRNGEFHFSNRSQQNCKLGRDVVQPNESVAWKPGKRVEFGEGVALQLSKICPDDRNIKQFLSLGKLKKATAFDQDEDQVVDDKVVAMVCAGLLFYALTLI